MVDELQKSAPGHVVAELFVAFCTPASDFRSVDQLNSLVTDVKDVCPGWPTLGTIELSLGRELATRHHLAQTVRHNEWCTRLNAAQHKPVFEWIREGLNNLM